MGIFYHPPQPHMGGKQPSEQRKLPPAISNNQSSIILSPIELVVIESPWEPGVFQGRKLNPVFLHNPPAVEEKVPMGVAGIGQMAAWGWYVAGAADISRKRILLVPIPEAPPEKVPVGLVVRYLGSIVGQWGEERGTQGRKLAPQNIPFPGDTPPGARRGDSLTDRLYWPRGWEVGPRLGTYPQGIDNPPLKKSGDLPKGIWSWPRDWDVHPFGAKFPQGYVFIPVDDPPWKRTGSYAPQVEQWPSGWVVHPTGKVFPQEFVYVPWQNPPWKKSGLWPPQVGQWPIGWELYQGAKKYTAGRIGQDPPGKKTGLYGAQVSLWPTEWNARGSARGIAFYLPDNPPWKRAGVLKAGEAWPFEGWDARQRTRWKPYGIDVPPVMGLGAKERVVRGWLADPEVARRIAKLVRGLPTTANIYIQIIDGGAFVMQLILADGSLEQVIVGGTEILQVVDGETVLDQVVIGEVDLSYLIENED